MAEVVSNASSGGTIAIVLGLIWFIVVVTVVVVAIWYMIQRGKTAKAARETGVIVQERS